MKGSELNWRKARRSSAQNGCVEMGITAAGRVAAIRDSIFPERGHLPVTPIRLGELLADVKAGKLNL